MLSFWAYPSKPGVLFAFRTARNSSESIVKIELNKSTDDTINMRYYNLNTNTYSTAETSTEKFCNVYIDGWKLFHVECLNAGSDYYTIQLKFHLASTVFSFTILSSGYQFSQGDTYYKIGDETSSWEGFVYQIWWYGASAADTSYFNTKPPDSISSWSSPIDTSAISSTATSACCDVTLYKNPPCTSVSYNQSNTPSTNFNGAGYHDLDKAVVSGCTGVIKPSASCSSCIGSGTTTGVTTCDDGYYLSSSSTPSCIPCQSGCLKCTDTSCLECQPYHYIQPQLHQLYVWRPVPLNTTKILHLPHSDVLNALMDVQTVL